MINQPYRGAHPANIAAHLRKLADRHTYDREALLEYADAIERLGRAAGIKFLGD